MPAGGSYNTGQAGDQVATVLKRRPASQRSYVTAGMGMNRERTGKSGLSTGKFGGIPGGPSGGGMNTGGKRRPGKRTVGK